MFMAYLFVIAPNWKQPKYTLTDEWTDKLVSLQVNNSSQKKEWTINMPNSMAESENNYDELKKRKRGHSI